MYRSLGKYGSCDIEGSGAHYRHYGDFYKAEWEEEGSGHEGIHFFEKMNEAQRIKKQRKA
jgi:hypothetical protein